MGTDRAGGDPTPRAGDGGAYRKTPTQLATDPAFTGTYASRVALFASVKDPAYGAKGDGTTDDTTAIQAAVAAVVAAGGGTLYFPAGTYITAPLKLYTNVRYQGATRRATTLKLKSGSNADFFTLATTSEQLCEVVDLTIDGNKAGNPTNGGHGIHILAGSGSGGGHRFLGLAIRNCAGSGVFSEGSYSGASTYTDIQVYGCDSRGFYITSHDSNFTLCDAGQSGLSGFRVEGNNNRFFQCNAWFSGRIDPTVGHGWYLVGAARSYLVGCQAQDSQANSFTLFNADKVTLFDCISDGASANGEGVQSAQSGVAFGLANVTNSIITGRAFNRFGTLTTTYGLKIAGTCTDNRVDVYVDAMANGSYTGTLTSNRVKITSPVSGYEVEIPNKDTGLYGTYLATGHETINRMFATSTGGPPASGTVNWTFFTARKTETITQLSASVRGTAAAALTLAKLGLYSVDASGNLTLAAQTASDTTMFGSTFSTPVRSTTASYTVVAGQRYALAVLCVGTTMPGLYAATAPVEQSVQPMITGILAGQSDLPASVAVGSIAVGGSAIYGKVLP